MKKGILGTLAFVYALTSCDPLAVKEDLENETVDQTDIPAAREADSIDMELNVRDELKLDNGIRIKWFERGTGGLLERGQVAAIDYKVFLEDETVIDGNHLLNKPSFPFMIGFNMQTEGWDVALTHLRVGDFAEVFIPSELARGEKGVEGLIPPNSNNILKIRVLSVVKPDREVDGNKVWLLESNERNKTKFSEKNTVEFHCMVSSESNPLYVNTFRTGNAFTLKLEDNGVVPGLKKALINAKKSDRMYVYVPASEAYGNKGYVDLVKPGEALFYNIMVMDITEK